MTLPSHGAFMAHAKDYAEAHAQDYKPPRFAYLWKECPRCKRIGAVFLLPLRGEATHDAIVIWDAPPRNPFGLPRDLDAVALKELFIETFGCGYCPPAEDA